MEKESFLYKIAFDGTVTIGQIEDIQNLKLLGSPKKLITGFTIQDGEISFENGESMKCVLQFQKDKLRYCMLYPCYKEFLEEPERWEQPTVDGSIEKEACVKWAYKYMQLEEKKSYEWGSIQIIYEQWIGKASIMFLYNK